MKIAMICYPTHGGSGVVASELGLALAKKGHEVHFVSYAVPFRLRAFHPNVFIHEVDVAAYPLMKYPPYALGLTNKLVEITVEYGIDILHAHYAVPHAVSAYLAKQILNNPKIKVITTLHGTDITLLGADKSFYRVIKYSIERSDGVTAVSDYLRDRTKKDFEIARDIRRIYNFIDVHKADNLEEGPCRRELYAPRDHKVLMHASNFRPIKRVSDVVRIFAQVRAAMPSKLLLIGEGPERLFIQQLARDLGLRDDVVFLGEVDYIEQLLNCADLFLLTSEHESFGLVALEAMICGVPVVGSITGGLPEVVIHGETGYLFPIGETNKMAEAAIALLRDENKRQQFAQNGRERARLFDLKRVLPEWEAYYQEVLTAESP